MSIEDSLDRLISAIEENTKALKGKGPVGRPVGSGKKGKEVEADDDDDLEEKDDDDDEGESTVTKEQLRKLLVRVKSEVGPEAVKPIMRLSNKAKTFDDIEEDDYDKCAAAAKKALKAAAT